MLSVVAFVVSIVMPVGAATGTAAICTSSVGPGIAPPASVPSGQPGLHAAWYGQSGYMSLCPGDVGTATVAYLNSGSIGWVAGRPGETAYLGTAGPEPGQDQPSPLGGDGTLGSPQTDWPSHNRMAVQPSPYVGPGQVAWFQFRLKAPATPGTYRLALRPLIEGTQWMEDYGVFWTIQVLDPNSPAARPIPPLRGTRQQPTGSLHLTSAMSALRSSEGGSGYPSIAVGRESFLVLTNPRTLIFSKTGVLLAERRTRQVFEAVIPRDTGTTDPRAIFDQRSGRYFLVAAAMKQCTPPACTVTWVVAVSRTSEPRSLAANDWYVYGFDGSLENGVPTGLKGDFNVVSLTDDTLVLVGISIPPDWMAYAKIWVFDKAPFLTGAPVSGPRQEFSQLRDPASGRVLQKTYPAVTFGLTDTVFLVSYSSSECGIAVVGVTGKPGTAQLKTHTARAPGVCVGPTSAPQLGGGVPLDTMPHFETPPVYRDGRLWLVQSILKQTGAGPVGGLRLVELDVSRWPEAPTYVTDATYWEPGIWYFNPALTVDAAHNVAIVANRSSEREYGSVWVTGRRAGDVNGAFRPPVALKHGEANSNWTETSHEPPIRQRNWFSVWSGAAIDPVDDSAWVVGQATRTACEWEVWVGRTEFTITAGTSGVSPAPPTPTVPSMPCRR